MPDDRKPVSGEENFDAALRVWERGAGDTPDPAPHPALAGLRAQFAAHPDVCALSRVLDFAQQDAGDPVPYMVKLEPRLLAVLEHIESLEAVNASRTPAPTERVLSLVLNNYLEDLLHRLVTDPTSHPHYARLWNGLCAKAGAPELAVPDGATPATPKAEDGPF